MNSTRPKFLQVNNPLSTNFSEISEKQPIFHSERSEETKEFNAIMTSTRGGGMKNWEPLKVDKTS